MKTKLNFLFIAILIISSCSNSEGNLLKPVDEILSEKIDIQINPRTTFTLSLLDTDESLLHFEIIKLDIGHATRVQTAESVQILDNSTYGYADALQIDELIETENTWSDRTSFVLGTSVGHAGSFEGNGPKYLAFRLIKNEDFQYGWVLLDNKQGNTELQIISYGLNQTSGKGILAGQVK